MEDITSLRKIYISALMFHKKCFLNKFFKLNISAGKSRLIRFSKESFFEYMGFNELLGISPLEDLSTSKVIGLLYKHNYYLDDPNFLKQIKNNCLTFLSLKDSLNMKTTHSILKFPEGSYLTLLLNGEVKFLKLKTTKNRADRSYTANDVVGIYDSTYIDELLSKYECEIALPVSYIYAKEKDDGLNRWGDYIDTKLVLDRLNDLRELSYLDEEGELREDKSITISELVKRVPIK